MSEIIHVEVQFSGGLELLFNNTTHIQLTFPKDKVINISKLIQILKEEHLKDRSELFVSEDTVRPGILVLINDTDWELEGETEYELKDKDTIVFISTLHGG